MARPLLAEKISRRIIADSNRQEALPSERDLAERYRCSRLTVRKALKLLQQNGIVDSQPRSGHFLTAQGLSQAAPPLPTMLNIVLFSMEERLRDPAHTFMLGGAIHQARLSNVNLIIKEIGDCSFAPLPALNALHPGVEAEAYIIAGAAPHAMLALLRQSGKPCIVLGKFYEQEYDDIEICCEQLLLSTAHVYQQVGRHLAELGHRHYLLASSYPGLNEIYEVLVKALPAESGYRVDQFVADLPRNERNPVTLRQAARQLVQSIAGQTALIITDGHIFALEVIRRLQAEGIRFPEDINLVIMGCETDWFLDTYDITCIYAEYRDQGAACVKEVLRQIRNGRVEFGIRFTPAHYIVRGSTIPLKAQTLKNNKL